MVECSRRAEYSGGLSSCQYCIIYIYSTGKRLTLYDVVSPAKILDDVDYVWDLAIDLENLSLGRG